MILINSIDCLNSAESTIGDVVTCGSTVIIPIMNLFIQKNHPHELLKNEYNKYIKEAYLILESNHTITLDYDVSRQLDEKSRKCFGGEYYFNGKHYEYWFSFNSGKLILPANFTSSSSMWPLGTDVDWLTRFFSCEAVNQIKKLLAENQY